MSYIPKYLLDRMFNNGGVELNGSALLITMNAMLRPIEISDFGNIVVKVFYQTLDTDTESPTYNEQITTFDEYSLIGDNLVLNHGEAVYTAENIASATNIINIGDSFTIQINDIQHVEVDTQATLEVSLKIYNPINLKFSKTVRAYVALEEPVI